MNKKFALTLFVLPALLFANEARSVIESIDRTVISAEIGGNVVSIPKNNGDYFKKGETLVKIECDIYEAQRDKIKVKRDLLQIKVDKNTQLEKYNSVGKFDIQTSKLELKEQELELKIAQINVNRCEIKAPFTGRVVQRLVSKHQNVTPQDQLLEIVNLNNIEAKIVVPATWINHIKIGKEFQIHIDEINDTVKAKVKQIDSVVDSKSQTMNLRATIQNNKNIVPGMSGTAVFKETNSSMEKNHD